MKNLKLISTSLAIIAIASTAIAFNETPSLNFKLQEEPIIEKTISQDFYFSTTGESYALLTYTPQWAKSVNLLGKGTFEASLGVATGSRFDGPVVGGFGAKAVLVYQEGPIQVYGGLMAYTFWEGNTSLSGRIGIVVGVRVFRF